MKKESLAKFENFLAVAKELSFTQAAKKLGVAKASLSRDIKSLEQQLKTPLLIRSTRRITLTDEGQLFVEQCQRLQYELENTRNLINSMHQEPSGVLRISSNPYLAEKHLLSPIETFLKRFPKIDVELLTEERIPDMQKEQVDLVFGVNWTAPSDVVAKPIGTTRYVLCASPAYLKKFGQPKNLLDLQENHHYIPHISRSSENLIASLKKPMKLTCHSRLKLNTAQLMKEAAAHDQGIVQLHEYVVHEELKSGQLVEILKECFLPEVKLMVYYQKHRYVQPKIRQFINLITS